MINSNYTTNNSATLKPVSSLNVTNETSQSPGKQVTASSAVDAYEFSEEAMEKLEGRLQAERRERFAEIALQAEEANAVDDPKAFLRQLSEDDLDILREAHGMTNSVNIDEINEEGAYNLLLPPHEGLDLNGDGFISVNDGRFGFFPLPNMSERDIAAWESATAHLSEKDKERWESRMVFAHGLKAWALEQNTGQANGKDLPSFGELVDMKLQSLEFSFNHGFIERDLYDQGTDLLNRFKQARQDD